MLALAACASPAPGGMDAGSGSGDAAPAVGLRIGDPCTPEQGWLPEGGVDAGQGRGALPPLGAKTCGLWPDAPDGYLSARCEQDRDCPDGARCGLGSYWCVARCRSNADCRPPASCHLSAAAAVSYCQVTGGVLARGDRDAGASDDCELPCGFYQTCCAAQCFDLANDPQHCGHCTHACGRDAPYCVDGQCEAAACTACEDGETCCAVYGPDGAVPRCVALEQGQTCPSGCHDC